MVIKHFERKGEEVKEEKSEEGENKFEQQEEGG